GLREPRRVRLPLAGGAGPRAAASQSPRRLRLRHPLLSRRAARSHGGARGHRTTLGANVVVRFGAGCRSRRARAEFVRTAPRAARSRAPPGLMLDSAIWGSLCKGRPRMRRLVRLAAPESGNHWGSWNRRATNCHRCRCLRRAYLKMPLFILVLVSPVSYDRTYVHAARRSY